MDFKTSSVMVYNAPTNNPTQAYIYEAGDRMNIPDFFKSSTIVEHTATIPDFIDKIVSVVGRPLIKMIPSRMNTVLEFDNVLITVPTIEKPFEEKRRVENLDLWGPMRLVEELVVRFKKAFPFSKGSIIEWYYSVDKKIRSSNIWLNHQHEAQDAFFPWIESGVAAFQKSYLQSSANILLLIGEPGCGKTSFVRDLIRRNDLEAAVTYDYDLMNNDQFFVDFIEGSDDLLIIEDADVILRDRESGNKVMDKILNSSDGLIITKKKIIFTANLTHLSEVDEALTRPGRCFETLIFREMTYTEAKVAAAVAGLPEPDGPMTLAKLFSDGPATKVPSRLGFG